MTYELLTQQVENQAALAYKYSVELASNDYELDYDLNEVPKSWKKIDVLVTERSENAVRNLVASAGWLKDFGIVSIWEMTEDPHEAPF